MKYPEINGERWMLERSTDIQVGDFVEMRNYMIVGPITKSDFGGGMWNFYGYFPKDSKDEFHNYAWNLRGQPWGENNPMSKHPEDIIRIHRKEKP